MRTLILIALLCFSALAQTVTIGPAVFTGSGLNDATSSGFYTVAPANAVYVVTISATGTPDHFTWTKNGGSASAPIAITGVGQALADGVKVTFAATTGHTLGNLWTITVTASGSSGAQTFIQHGPGAVFRTQQEKSRDMISVLDFGVIGSTTNSTAFVQAAINSATATGKAVYFPALGFPYLICDVTYNGAAATPVKLHGDGLGASLINRHSSCLQAATNMIHLLNVPVEVDGIGFDMLTNGTETTKNILFIEKAPSVSATKNRFAHAQNVGLQIVDSSNVRSVGNSFYQNWFFGEAASCTGGAGGTGGSPTYLHGFTSTGDVFEDTPFGLGYNFFCTDIAVSGDSFTKSSLGFVQTPNANATVSSITIDGGHTFGLAGSLDGIFLEGAGNVRVSGKVTNPAAAGVHCQGSELTIAPGPTIPLPCNNLTIDTVVSGALADFPVKVNGSSFPGTISSCTNANPVVCTASYAPATGESITLAGFTGGWAGLNGTFTATGVTATTFHVPVDSSGFGGFSATSPTWVILGSQIAIKGTHVTNGLACGVVTSSVGVTIDSSACDTTQVGGWTFGQVFGGFFTNNDLHNIGIAASSSYDGVDVTDGSLNISVLHNSIKNDPGVNQMQCAIYDQAESLGSSAHATTDGNEIQGAAVEVCPLPDVPTVGAWLQGDKRQNFGMTGGGAETAGWINVSAGSPGSWRPQTNIPDVFGYYSITDPLTPTHLTKMGVNHGTPRGEWSCNDTSIAGFLPCAAIGTQFDFLYGPTGASYFHVDPSGTTVSNLTISGTCTGCTAGGISYNGHTLFSGSPTLGSCGTGGSIGGNDNVGTVLIGSGTVTSCTVIFGAAFTNAPSCTFTISSSSATPYKSSVTTLFAAAGFTSNAGGSQMDYHCF